MSRPIGMTLLTTALASIFLCAARPTLAFAQSASQVTPKSFAPPIQTSLGGGLAIGGTAGLDTPAGADKLFVTLSGATIENGLPALADATAALQARLSGKRISGAEVFAAARDLEAAYARAGYVLVRVILPKQQLVNGAKLKLIVVDGFIERIEVKDVPERVRQHIADVLAPLTGARGVMLKDLERRILLASDTPGVVLRSSLSPGSAPGATILVIGANYQPVVGSLTLDNTPGTSLGGFEIGVGADFNSLFGLGDLAYVRANGYPTIGDNGFFSQYALNRSLAAGLILPIGIDGTTVNIEGTLARTTPQPTAAIGSTDLFDRLSFRLRHPWIRSRDLNVAGSAILDIEDETSSLIAGSATAPLSQDRLRVVRFTGDADYLTAWGGTVTASVTASFGLNALGARSAADASALLPLSRQGANDTFSKLEGTLGYSQSLMEHLATNITAHAQTSFGQALLHAEQIGIAGPTMLSAFDSGLLVGDSGFIIRDEISAPFSSNTPIPAVGGVLSPYIFGAIGEIFLQDPTALERSTTRAAAYGFGAHLGAAAAGTLSNGSLTLEFARQARNDGQPIDNRVTLVTSIKF